MPDFNEVIHECSSMLDGRAVEAGVTLRMRSPILSVIIGEEAIANQSHIERAYRDCWGAAVDELPFINNGEYSEQNITERVRGMLGEEHFATRNCVILAWYWDIMRSDFDTIMDRVPTVAKAFPLGIQVSEYFFIFCKQFAKQDGEITQERLKKLIEWADRHGKILIVQSDITYGGTYNSGNIWKCYRGAANCMVIANTVSAQQLGENLDHLLSHSGNTVWSIGNYTLNKSNKEIVVASFQRILREYTSRYAGAGHAGFLDVPSRLAGNNATYSDLFDKLIKEWDLLPNIPNCIGSLPYTDEMKSFLNNPFKNRFALIRSNQNEIDKEKRSAAIASLREFWSLFMETYYRQKLNALKSGKNWMKTELVAVLSRCFSVAEMSSANFDREAKELREREWKNSGLRRSNDSDACTSLHNYACNELLQDVYKFLAETLSVSMNELSRAAKGFDAIVNAVELGLNHFVVEESIKVAYGNHVHDLLVRKPDVLFRIHPCETTEMLFQQIKEVFIALAADDPVYKYSLQQDIRFRFEATGSNLTANDVMSGFFNVDMTNTGALRLFNPAGGHNYCLMNNNDQLFDNNTIPESIGTVFGIPGSDYIDRLYIYPVEPDQIIY